MAISYTDIARDLIRDLEAFEDDFIQKDIEFDEVYGNEVRITFKNKAGRRIEQALKQAVKAFRSGGLIDV